MWPKAQPGMCVKTDGGECRQRMELCLETATGRGWPAIFPHTKHEFCTSSVLFILFFVTVQIGA